MRLAASFPLESLTFGGQAIFVAPKSAAAAHALPEQRAVMYDGAVDLVDGRGDGPLIGLGSGSNLEVAGSR